MKIFKKIIKSLIPKTAKNCAAIIVAAGSGSRMGIKDQTKQMMLIGGIPVVVRTIKQFEECPEINEIIIVARQDEVVKYKEFIKEYEFKKIKAVTQGSDTRQKSVLCGFALLDDKCDFVAIHDGARPLITPYDIKKILNEAEKFGAASAACHAKDTVKITDENGFVTETPSRELVWNAQTPQIFKADLYRAAAFYAMKKEFKATDDNSLIEFIGAKVKMVDCGYENLKITTIEDIYSAETILNMRKNRND